MTETEKINRKITSRFLKEIGLKSAWNEYIRPFKSKGRNIYDKCYVDSVFNDVNFTDFLRFKKNIIIKSPITCIFRHWFAENYLRSKHGSRFYDAELSCFFITPEKNDYELIGYRIFLK